MAQVTLNCCSNKPDFLVTYSVSGSEKNYLVCSSCITLECFSKYILEKTPIRTQPKKIFQNDENVERDEHEDNGEKMCESAEENERFTSEVVP